MDKTDQKVMIDYISGKWGLENYKVIRLLNNSERKLRIKFVQITDVPTSFYKQKLHPSPFNNK